MRVILSCPHVFEMGPHGMTVNIVVLSILLVVLL